MELSRWLKTPRSRACLSTSVKCSTVWEIYHIIKTNSHGSHPLMARNLLHFCCMFDGISPPISKQSNWQTDDIVLPSYNYSTTIMVVIIIMIIAPSCCFTLSCRSAEAHYPSVLWWSSSMNNLTSSQKTCQKHVRYRLYRSALVTLRLSSIWLRVCFLGTGNRLCWHFAIIILELKLWRWNTYMVMAAAAAATATFHPLYTVTRAWSSVLMIRVFRAITLV